MHKVVVGIVCALFFGHPAGSTTGGNLHQSNMEQWSQASFANREATAANFAAAMMQRIEHRQFTLGEFELLSMELAQCLDSAADDPGKTLRRANEVAVSCFLILRPDWVN